MLSANLLVYEHIQCDRVSKTKQIFCCIWTSLFSIQMSPIVHKRTRLLIESNEK